MSARWALALALLLSGTGAVAGRKPAPTGAPRLERPLKRVRGVAQVTYVSAARVYLDRGAADGLTAGELLKLTRKGRPAGSCKVEWLSASWASCAGKGLLVADRAALPAFTPPPTAQPRPIPGREELSRRRERLEAAAPPKVAFKPGARPATAGGARVALSHRTWASTGSSAGPFQQQRVDVGLFGVELAWGVRAWAELSVVGWGRRWEGFRAFGRAPVQLHVHEAALVLREPERSLAFAAGRTHPRFVPGLLVLDGAQAGFRDKDGEAGVFAGTIPDAVTLAPSPSRFTAGAYFTRRLELPAGVVRPEARLAWVGGSAGGRLEGELATHGALPGSADAHLQALFGLGIGADAARAPGLLEALRLDVALRRERVEARAGVRYDWTDAREVVPLGAAGPSFHGVRADASASYELTRAITVGAQGGFGRDVLNAQWRGYAGPELGFPRALGERGALSLGYQEELGWLSGRSGWLQATLYPGERVRLLSRASYEVNAPRAGLLGYAGQELGLYLGVEARVWSWLWLRGSLLGRAGVTAEPLPLGGTGGVQLRGDF